MVNLDWDLDSRNGTALVELVVSNPASVARRVRIGNRLDGPVWPPRREGVFEAGWDAGGFEGVVAPGERLALGYASPAPPVEPPAEIVWSERAESDPASTERAPGARSAGDSHADTATTPSGVVRALGDGRPPADVVPVALDGATGNADSDFDLPDAVESWFETVEGRVERAAAADETLRTDRETLLAVAERAERLAERAGEANRSSDDARRTT